MEIRLGRFPYTEVWDGVLPVKIRDEFVLENSVFRIVIPEEHFARLAPVIPDALSEKILRVKNACRDIRAWSETVYGLIERADAEERGRTSV